MLFVSGHEPGYDFKNVDGINYLVVGNLVSSNMVENFVSMEARYNKYTKEASVIIEKHGEYAETFEIKKKIGKLDLWQ